MEEIYSKALRFYQQNNYETALNLIRLCEPSSKVNALTQECTKSLKNQYQILIDECKGISDQEYIDKYILLLGYDEYISNLVHNKTPTVQKVNTIQTQSSEIKASGRLVTGPLAFLDKYGIIIAVVAGLFFSYDIITWIIGEAPHWLYLDTAYLFFVAEKTVLLFLLYVIGNKFLRFNKLYVGIVTTAIIISICHLLLYWYYSVFEYENDTLREFTFMLFNFQCYESHILIVAFILGIAFTKHTIGKLIFILLSIYAGIKVVLDLVDPVDPELIYHHLQHYVEYALLLLVVIILIYEMKFRPSN